GGESGGVLQGEAGARADGVVGGVGGVADQDQVAAVRGAVGDGAEGLPGGGAAGAGAAGEGVAVEDVGPDLLQQGECLRPPTAVDSAPGEGAGAALDHAVPAAGPVGVAVAPDPAVLGGREGVGEGRAVLGGAAPAVGVGSGGAACAETVSVAGAQGAGPAAGGPQPVAVGQPVGRDFAAE